MNPTLPPQAWRSDPATQRVLAALGAEGTEVRFVGGCVRDALLGRPVSDIDIATPDRPETVVRLLERARIKAVPTGIAHGTVTAVADGRPFEVTTLRRDVETDGRHARVAFTDDWEADAARRDFTMNALSATPDGHVHDPFGGIADLASGLVRFVGDPAQRLEEDVLRLLRFFRFHAHYGRDVMDPAGLAACIAAAPRLGRLSAERVRVEILKLLAAPEPVATLRTMRETGILDHVLPEARRLDRLAALIAIVHDETLQPDPIRRLAALLDGGPDLAIALGKRLRLSNLEVRRLEGALQPDADLGTDPPGMRRALYRLGTAAYRDRALLAAAENATERNFLARRLAEVAAWKPRTLPVNGHDVLALGVPGGEAVGRVLAELERWWIDGDFQADRKACLERLREIAHAP